MTAARCRKCGTWQEAIEAHVDWHFKSNRGRGA